MLACLLVGASEQAVQLCCSWSVGLYLRPSVHYFTWIGLVDIVPSSQASVRSCMHACTTLGLRLETDDRREDKVRGRSELEKNATLQKLLKIEYI